MRMPPTTRLAAGLLLVYPALLVSWNARAALEFGDPSYLIDNVLIVPFLLIVSVRLWRGRRWAYGAALVCSLALTCILVLYEWVVWRMYGAEAWEEWSAFDFVLHYVPFVALAAAFALLMRERAFSGTRWRPLGLLAAAVAVEVVLIALIASLGYGHFWGDRTWYHALLQGSQLPGMTVLEQMEMCCGYENHNIITDGLVDHWGPITLHGLPVLVTANALGILPLLLLARSLLRRGFGARRAAAASTA
jgi:hypothetical protein